MRTALFSLLAFVLTATSGFAQHPIFLGWSVTMVNTTGNTGLGVATLSNGVSVETVVAPGEVYSFVVPEEPALIGLGLNVALYTPEPIQNLNFVILG